MPKASCCSDGRPWSKEYLPVCLGLRRREISLNRMRLSCTTICPMVKSFHFTTDYEPFCKPGDPRSKRKDQLGHPSGPLGLILGLVSITGACRPSSFRLAASIKRVIRIYNTVRVRVSGGGVPPGNTLQSTMPGGALHGSELKSGALHQHSAYAEGRTTPPMGVRGFL